MLPCSYPSFHCMNVFPVGSIACNLAVWPRVSAFAPPQKNNFSPRRTVRSFMIKDILKEDTETLQPNCKLQWGKTFNRLETSEPLVAKCYYTFTVLFQRKVLVFFSSHRWKLVKKKKSRKQKGNFFYNQIKF